MFNFLKRRPADRLTPAEVRARLAENPSARLLDVRSPGEYAGGHLAGARNLDALAPDFAARAAGLPREGPYFLYCRSGSRSGRAAEVMRGLGHDAHNVGGLDALVRAGFETA